MDTEMLSSRGSSPTPDDESAIEFSPIDFSDNEWVFSHAVVTPRDLIYEAAAVRFKKIAPPVPATAEDIFNYAGWFSFEHPHRPYLPDIPSYQLKLGDTLKNISWMYYEYKEDLAEEFMDPKDPTRLDPEVVDIIEDDFKVAKAALDWFEERAKLKRYAVDHNYSILRLRQVQGLSEVLKEIRHARAQALDLVAAVSYNLAYVDQDTESKFCKIYGPYMRWWLTKETKIGALIDPTDRYMHTYPLLKMVKDGCPVYLPWDFCYRPTTGIAERVALSNMTGEQFVNNVNRAFPLPEPEQGDAPKGSLLSRLTEATSVPTAPRIQRLLDLVAAGDCLFGDVAKPSALPRWNLHISWDAKVLEWGYALLDSLPEVRLRRFALTYVLVSDVPAGVVLGEALQRGLPFTLAYPPAAAKAFHPEGSQWSLQAPSPYDDVITGPFLDSSLFPATSWEEYKRRIGRLTARPEAVGILAAGHLPARLALEFGSPLLTGRLLKGPSPRAHRIRQGAYTENDLYADTPHPAVYSILIGTVEGLDQFTRKYWFPPLDLVERYLLQGGAWTKLSEDWFVGRLAVINKASSPNAKPLTRAQWVRLLKKRVRRRVASRSKVEPDEQEIESYRDDFYRETKRSWDTLKLSEVRINILTGRGISLNSAA
ncbi:hypothetical protein BC629DRAFT_1590796 [Irpex lacteus]|nr:hypothetical protein BC629DRAFT_1590796 [Irpex lacteus]